MPNKFAEYLAECPSDSTVLQECQWVFDQGHALETLRPSVGLAPILFVASPGVQEKHPYFRPCVMLPLTWKKGIPADARLPVSFHELAKQARAAVCPKNAWSLYLHDSVGDWDFSTAGDLFSPDSGYLQLVASLLLAQDGHKVDPQWGALTGTKHAGNHGGVEAGHLEEKAKFVTGILKAPLFAAATREENLPTIGDVVRLDVERPLKEQLEPYLTAQLDGASKVVAKVPLHVRREHLWAALSGGHGHPLNDAEKVAAALWRKAPALGARLETDTSFFGRERELAQLSQAYEASISDESIPAVWQIVAPSGQGKTAVARQLLSEDRVLLNYRDRRAFLEFSSVHSGSDVWIAAKEGFGAKDAEGKALDWTVWGSEPRGQVLGHVGKVGALHGPWLIVLDNFESVLRAAPDVATDLIRSLLRLHARLVITTQQKVEMEGLKNEVIKLPALPEASALALFQQVSGEAWTEDLAQVGVFLEKELGGNPQVIVLVGSYAKGAGEEGAVSFNALAEVWESRRAEMLLGTSEDAEEPKLVTAARLLLGTQWLDPHAAKPARVQTARASRALLLAMLAFPRIPDDPRLRQVWSALLAEGKMDSDDGRWNVCRQVLHDRFCLVHKRDSRWNMSSPIRWALSQVLQATETCEMVPVLSAFEASASPGDADGWRWRELALAWHEWSGPAPSKDCLLRAEERIPAYKLAGVVAAWRELFGEGESEMCVERVVASEIKKIDGEPDHPDAGMRLNSLAALYQSQGRYADAEPLYLRALEIAEKTVGLGHPDAGVTFGHLATLYQYQGCYTKAEEFFVRALDIAEKTEGSEHPNTGAALNNLACLYDSQGCCKDAEPLHVRAMAIAEKTEGSDHPNTAMCLNNLAACYKSQARYEDAEPLCARALKIMEKAEGPEHPSTGVCLNNLAGLYESQGRYKEAEPLHALALEIARKFEGPEHPNTGRRMDSLAGLYQSQGRYEEAEPLYQSALAIAEKTEGPEHPSTGARLHNLAVLYGSKGCYGKAVPLCRRALAIAEKAEGPEHLNTGAVLSTLAYLYKSQYLYVEAERLYRHALAIAEKAEGPEHLNTGLRMNNLAILYASQGRYLEAQWFFARALPIIEKTYGSNHLQTMEILKNLNEVTIRSSSAHGRAFTSAPRQFKKRPR